MNKKTEIIEEVEVDGDRGGKSTRDLFVFNDDHNTFQHVIQTLTEVCKHTRNQAEQCTYLIHFRGKCAVKKGPFEVLKPMEKGILSAGINAKIV